MIDDAGSDSAFPLSIHSPCPCRPFSNQMPETGTRTGRIPSSQSCRSAGQNASTALRDAPTVRSGQGNFGWVYFGDGLCHVRLIHLISLCLTSNHPAILRSEGTTAGGLQEWVYTWFRRVVEWMEWYSPYRPLSSARIASFSSSRGASSFLSTRSNCQKSARATVRLFSPRTSCTKRKKCR